MLTLSNFFFFFLLFKIRAIDRKQEVPHDGPMCDLLWSDPEGKYMKLSLMWLLKTKQSPDNWNFLLFLSIKYPFDL